MDGRPGDQREDSEADQPLMPAQAELEAMFDADDVDVAAGRLVPAEPVLAGMRAVAARIRRERQAKEAMAPRHS